MEENDQNDCEEGLFVESHYKFETIELPKKISSLEKKEIIPEPDSQDIIPLSVKLFYSIPSFSKMSCLVILR